ncbi:ubiquitin-associated protein 2-like isoform X1 [Lates japonicus]|uniref:Ubiquitin-associated protein 2-like isoform X1 n=1 Tax=Lates japonicus TaxID=270547 RepID=A0AAD3R2V4_LATJO|nr:ubiquitin-associated protein 2-like isoform X1 [Lates japonicus]
MPRGSLNLPMQPRLASLLGQTIPWAWPALQSVSPSSINDYGQHAYSAPAFDDLSQAHAGEYSKGGYGGSAQSQAKSAGRGAGKDDSTVKSVLEKAPGLSGSIASGDPRVLLALCSLPASCHHALAHSQLLPSHLQDGQGGPGQRSQSSSMQQKTQGSKSSYGSSPYWAN